MDSVIVGGILTRLTGMYRVLNAGSLREASEPQMKFGGDRARFSEVFQKPVLKSAEPTDQVFSEKSLIENCDPYHRLRILTRHFSESEQQS
jgi:hypothetical protein